MDWLSGIGDFFGGLFGQKKKREDQPQQAQATSKPLTLNVQQSPSPSATIAQPQSLIPQNTSSPSAPVVSTSWQDLNKPTPTPQVKPLTLASPNTQSITLAKPTPTPTLTLDPRSANVPSEPDEPPLWKKIVGGFQQAGGQVGDLALQGGGLLTILGNDLNPFIDKQEKDRRLQQEVATLDKLRSDWINSHHDINGNVIVGNRDVDQAASNIAAGQGSAQDWAAVGGRGLDIGNTSTMFINPGRAVFMAAPKSFIPKAPQIIGEMGLFGGAGGAAAGLGDFGQNGDVAQALKTAGTAALTDALVQGTLHVAGHGAGRAYDQLSGRLPGRGLSQLSDDAERFAENSARNTEHTTLPGEVPETATRNPNSPFTSADAAPKEPAITSVTPQPRPFTTPTPESAPTTAATQIAQAQATVDPWKQIDDIFGPSEATKTAQKAVKEAQATPAEVPQAVATEQVKPATLAKSEQVAAETAPVNPEAVQAAQAAQVAKEAPTEAIAQAANVPAEGVAKLSDGIGDYRKVHKNARASVPGKPSIKYTTGDAHLDDIVHDAIIAYKGSAATVNDSIRSLRNAGLSDKQIATIRNYAVKNVDKMSGKISNPQKILDILDNVEAPKVASTPVTTTEPPLDLGSSAKTPTDELGNITRNAVLDGSVNNPAQHAEIIARTEKAADAAAEAAGDSIENIVRKGQRVWQKSRAEKHDLTTAEAEELVPGFTKEQQSVYKRYAQEITTLRDRGGFSLDGGYQGAWYGPRQSLTELGESAEFDPRMVNEFRRNKDQINDGVTDDMLDISKTPYSQAITRYLNAPDRASQVLTDTVENFADGTPRGIKVPDTAKSQLEDSFADIVKDRDAALKLQDSGDVDAAKAAASDINKKIDKAFSDFIDEIPGSGSARRGAVNDVKALRGAYKQTTMATLTLSNVVNRVADQATKLGLVATRPLVRQFNKTFTSYFAKRAKSVGGEVNPLNLSKEAKQAAKNFSRGTLWREIKDNFHANMTLAGAGTKNPIAKALAKIDTAINASGAASTQAGDISTQIAQRVFEIGLSRPGAKGLKTTAEYEKYLASYVNSTEFKHDLDIVNRDLLPRIGLAGGNEGSRQGGSIAKFMSSIDNAPRNLGVKMGVSRDNRVLNEATDYWKGNITGYAGVGTRVMGPIMNAMAGGVPKFRKAIKLAESGDETAVAQATSMAAQSVADAVAFYGTGAAAALAAIYGKNVIGFTGAQPTIGSSDSAYNKSHNIPANQWYLNIGGKRLYFDPARPFAGPGVAADLAGGAVTGKNPLKVAQNTATQVYNQAGGSSLPETLSNLTTFMSPSSPEYDRTYAGKQLQATLAPATGVLNNIGNFTDSVKRAPTNFVEDIKANLPGLRQSVPAAKDAQGNEIPNSKRISGGSSIFSVADNPNNSEAEGGTALGSELSRLQAKYGNVFPTTQNTNASNANVQTLAGDLLNTPLYKNASDDDKAAMLKDALGGSKFKDISTDIDTPYREALIQTKLLGADKTKVWLDDNDNNYNYQHALWANGEANDTLDADDKRITKTGSLAQKVAIADVRKKYNVPEDVLGAYEDLTKAQFNALADDSDMKKQLIAYDQALVKAGLSSKFQNSKGGYGSTSGSGRKSFVFADLPQSLITAKDSTKSYEKAQSLFKAPASLQVPTVANIPKGRTISVKKGVQL